MPSASLQSASGSSPTCYFCALSVCHGKASISGRGSLFLPSETEMGCGKERQCAVEDSYYHNVLGRGNEIFWGKKFIVHVLNSSEISLKDSVPSGFSCSMYFSLLWD